MAAAFQFNVAVVLVVSIAPAAGDVLMVQPGTGIGTGLKAISSIAKSFPVVVDVDRLIIPRTANPPPIGQLVEEIRSSPLASVFL